MSRLGRWVCLGAALSLAVATGAAAAPERVDALQARTEIPESNLLDVGITLFDPGLPPGDESALEQEGVFPEVRKSESRFLPVRLMSTLQETGFWGAVRVIPAGSDSVDLVISGRIVESNGLKLILEVTARDARGRIWLDNRYKELADPAAFQEKDGFLPPDPFQNLYNRIANDLVAARGKLDDDHLREVRTVSRLRFAGELAPAAFGDYLARDRKGRYVAVRLPADDDPMMARIAEIRERDFMLVDTLNEYYAGFAAQMEPPYDDWRKFSYEEMVAQRDLKRSARTRKILGAVAILGGILMEPESQSEATARDAAIIGGAVAVKSGIDKGKEAKIHTEALRELGSSFDSEVEPLLVDVEGQTLRLTGSAETQYATWRKLLRELFIEETGLPVDPNTPADRDPGGSGPADVAPDSPASR